MKNLEFLPEEEALKTILEQQKTITGVSNFLTNASKLIRFYPEKFARVAEITEKTLSDAQSKSEKDLEIKNKAPRGPYKRR